MEVTNSCLISIGAMHKALFKKPKLKLLSFTAGGDPKIIYMVKKIVMIMIKVPVKAQPVYRINTLSQWYNLYKSKSRIN